MFGEYAELGSPPNKTDWGYETDLRTGPLGHGWPPHDASVKRYFSLKKLVQDVSGKVLIVLNGSETGLRTG